MTARVRSDYASQVAAEVAARYGATVSADVVQIVPRGTSGRPLPVWIPGAGPESGRLIYPEIGSWKGAQASRRAAEARRRGSAANPAVAARREKVRQAHEQGMNDPAIAAQLGLRLALVQEDRRFLGLAPHPAPRVPHPAEIAARRTGDEVQRLHGEGCTDAVIAERLRISRRTVVVHRAARNLPANAAPRRSRRCLLDREDLRARVARGETDAQIAAATRVGVSTVGNARRALGLRANTAGETEEAAAEMRRMASAGMGLREMARALGMGTTRARILRDKLGIAAQPRCGVTRSQAASARQERLRGILTQHRAEGTWPTHAGLRQLLGVKRATINRDLRRIGEYPLGKGRGRDE